MSIEVLLFVFSLLSVIFLTIKFIDLKNKSFIVFYLPLFNIFFDICIMHASVAGFESINYIRGFLTLIIILFLWFKYVKSDFLSNSIIIYLIFLVSLAIFRSDSFLSLLNNFSFISKLTITLMILPIALNAFDSFEKLKLSNSILLYTLIIFLSYIIVVNVFNIGSNLYFEREEDFLESSKIIRSGALDGNSFNILSYIILLSPVIQLTYKKKFFLTILIAVSLLILLDRKSVV